MLMGCKGARTLSESTGQRTLQKVSDGHFSKLSDHSREMDMQAPSMAAEWPATERNGCKS